MFSFLRKKLRGSSRLTTWWRKNIRETVDSELWMRRPTSIGSSSMQTRLGSYRDGEVLGERGVGWGREPFGGIRGFRLSVSFSHPFWGSTRFRRLPVDKRRRRPHRRVGPNPAPSLHPTNSLGRWDATRTLDGKMRWVLSCPFDPGHVVIFFIFISL